MANSNAEPLSIEPAVAKQAVELLLAWQDAEDPDSVWVAIGQWRAAHPEHEQAWQQIERVNQQFRRIQASQGGQAAHQALTAAKIPRRTVLKGLAALMLMAGAGVYSQQQRPWEVWNSDYRTARGDRHTITLPDGSELTLNSDTAIRIRPTPGEYRIVLQRGEIFVRTAHDISVTEKPLSSLPMHVITGQGQITPLGTRFSVRQWPEQSSVAVYHGQVRVYPAEGGEVSLVEAGATLQFNRYGSQALSAADESDAAWVQGMIVAQGMPLTAFLEELRRYHPGILRADPDLHRLKVSGTYPIDQLDPILHALEVNLPLRVRQIGPLWTQLIPATRKHS